MGDGLVIERGLGEANLADEGIGLVVEMVDLSGAVDAEIVIAEEDKEVFRLTIADGAGLAGIHRYI